MHRKGATSAREGELGIIPGSMGTPSYIVKGRGTADSFMSCSHGAGRNMGRNDASRRLKIEDVDKSMEGIFFTGWSKYKRGKLKGQYNFGEAPEAYKPIEEVIGSQSDLVEVLVKLKPLGVIKGD